MNTIRRGRLRPHPVPPVSGVALGLAPFLLALGLAAFAGPARGQAAPVGEFPNTDFEKRTVELSEIMSGGPPRDGIPAVDHPRHVTPAQAGEWLDPDEPVIAVEIGGETRAYPLQILIWHEIANDALGGGLSRSSKPFRARSIFLHVHVCGHRFSWGSRGRDGVARGRRPGGWPDAGREARGAGNVRVLAKNGGEGPCGS